VEDGHMCRFKLWRSQKAHISAVVLLNVEEQDPPNRKPPESIIAVLPPMVRGLASN